MATATRALKNRASNAAVAASRTTATARLLRMTGSIRELSRGTMTYTSWLSWKYRLASTASSSAVP